MAKSINVSTHGRNTCQTSDSTWDFAISEAQGEIEQLKNQLSRLEMAIQTFKKHKKEGVIWPNLNIINKSIAKDS
jgi:hypothetical protein